MIGNILRRDEVIEFLFNIAAIVIFNKIQSSRQKKNQLIFNLPMNN